ncbi:SprT-like family-domain-containing protein [Trametes punicea]|nr:SprT-like family-domain-containing protein [Trametes punicea]
MVRDDEPPEASEDAAHDDGGRKSEATCGRARDAGALAWDSPSKSKSKSFGSHEPGPNAPFSFPARLKAEPTVVSDSEEERQRRVKAKRAVLVTVHVSGLPVIEIPDSDEEFTAEDASKTSVVAQKGRSQTPSLTQPTLVRVESSSDEVAAPIATYSDQGDPRCTPRAGRHLVCNGLSTTSQDDAMTGGDLPPRRPRRRLPPDDDVIDLTVSSPEPESPRDRAGCPPAVPGKEKDERDNRSLNWSPRKRFAKDGVDADAIPLFVDGGSSDDSGNDHDDPFALDDGSILTLNEPRSARKPARRLLCPSSRKNPEPTQTQDDSDDSSPSKPGSSTGKTLLSDTRPTTPTGPRPAKARTPRVTKNMLLRAQRERLRAYAAAFFKEVNEGVFDGGLPPGTELVWSNRLLSTAGRAHWKRDREGRNLTSIELAEKILDCEERIRNTLSHEMCHLASWLISGAPDEQHGSIFKGWAQKVMRKRQDVEITTKHNYEINHKYRWKCEDCSKVYGRHSKSIKPEEHVCGVCKGRLIPQFETAKRAPRTPKPKADSRNATSRSQDSPLVMPGAFPASPAPGVKAKETPQARITIELTDDDNSDIEILAHTFKQVQIIAADKA